MSSQRTNDGSVSPEISTEGALAGGSSAVPASAGDSLPPPGIAPSYIVEQLRFEEISGLQLNPKVLELSPQGSRLIVLLNPPREHYGGLVLPEEYRTTEKSGSGWVVSVGPLVGTQCAHPGGPVGSPWALLYKQVIFGSYAGKVVQVEFFDTQTKSPFLMMTDRDLWGIDHTPSEHLTASP